MKSPDKSDVPSVIVGGGLNALGIVRSLGSAGVPLVVVDSNPKSPAMQSRYGKKLVFPHLEGQDFVDCLLNLAKNFSGPAVLFVTEEKTVIAISNYRDQLCGAFLLRLPPHERLMQLMRKEGFQELAETWNAPVPKIIRLNSVDDLQSLQQLKFPCILKPNSKSYAYGARFKKAYKVASVTEVAGLYEEIQPVLADMVVQEWIEGKDSDIYFCLQYIGKDGEIVSSFTGRKIRSWPPRIGGTASCTAAWDVAKELEETTCRFFRQVGFTGMGSMEYKRDQRDGKFYMIEPTVARTDFQEEVATINGINIPLAAYRYESGQKQLPERKESIPKIWRDPLSDRWSLEEGNEGIDNRSRFEKVCDAYWRWNDPMPWINFTFNRIVERLTRTN